MHDSLAIGIDDYKPPIELDNAVNDANRIYDLLDKESLRSGEKIERYKLLNQDATFDGIRQQLKTLKTKVKENDRLIFYYAGHGIALHSQESTESDLKQNPAQGESKQTPKNKPRGYLIPYDADMEGRKNYLSMDDLLDWLGDIQCRHGLIILDCCYAGSIQWSLDKTRQMLVEKIYPSVLDNYISKQAWFILTSSDENEKANDGMPTDLKPEEQLTKKTRNSPFVRCLHEALVDSKADMYPKDGDKIITTAELETYLSEVTNRTSQFNGEESRQTPQRFKLTGKHQGGEFVFLLNDFETIKTQLPKDPDVTADDKHNPYRGLNSFTEDHKDCFFGRERVTEKLFNHVCDHRLTVVLGTSGVGKSSLVNAGLIPKLKETSQEAESSQSSNAEAKTTRPPNSEPKSPQVEWNHERFRPGQSPAKALEEALNKLEAKNSPENTKRLLVIDQFEEVETQCRDDKLSCI